MQEMFSSLRSFFFQRPPRVTANIVSGRVGGSRREDEPCPVLLWPEWKKEEPTLTPTAAEEQRFLKRRFRFYLRLFPLSPSVPAPLGWLVSFFYSLLRKFLPTSPPRKEATLPLPRGEIAAPGKREREK